LVTVTAAAMTALLMNMTGSGGVTLFQANSHPSSVNGCGRIVSWTESGSVLNEVMTDHAKGTNISSA